MATPPRYKDISPAFGFHPVTKDLITITDVEAVKKSIINLVLTRFYERPFQPSIGTSVYRLLFENYTPITGSLIQREIQDVIRNFEPRAELLTANVVPDIDGHAITIQVVFSLKATKQVITFDFIVDRVR